MQFGKRFFGPGGADFIRTLCGIIPRPCIKVRRLNHWDVNASNKTSRIKT